MDIKKDSKQFSDSSIRTMAQDIAKLGGKAPVQAKEPVKEFKTEQKKAAPPASLPVTSPPITNSPPIIKTIKEPIKQKPKQEIKTKKIKTKKIGIKWIKKLNLALIVPIAVIILIIGSIGGFFYWWNYLRAVPVDVSHYECQDNQCLIVQGEGANQCQNDTDCQPVDALPDSLIPITETKIIELIIDQENLLLGQIKELAAQEQATSTINRILVKVVNQEDEQYLNLNSLILALNINIPETIVSTTKDNYTLFLYSQPQGNRLGLVIDMDKSDTLVQDLFDWETSLVADLNFFLLLEESSQAAAQEFQDNVLNGVSIRYINFDTPILSLDYALVAGNLVITTSRESMFAIINTLNVPDSN